MTKVMLETSIQEAYMRKHSKEPLTNLFRHA